MGDCRNHVPVLAAEWRPGFNCLWRHPRWLWLCLRCHVACRNVFDVRHVSSSFQLCCFRAASLLSLSSDPVVGAQYRWSARFAPAAPRFFAMVQGTSHLLLHVHKMYPNRRRMAHCRGLDHHLGGESSQPCQHCNRPNHFQQPRLRLASVAYCLADVAVYHHTPRCQPLVPKASNPHGELWIHNPHRFLHRLDCNFGCPQPTQLESICLAYHSRRP